MSQYMLLMIISRVFDSYSQQERCVLESLVEKWSTNLTTFSFLRFAIPGYSGLCSVHSY